MGSAAALPAVNPDNPERLTGYLRISGPATIGTVTALLAVVVSTGSTLS
jgi:hypothetical protein